MEKQKTYRIILSGRVQGVGFRYFTEDQANVNNIKGYVKNTINNKVEVVCQGNDSDIEMFIREIKKGPAFASVADFQMEPLTGEAQFEVFEIRY